MNKHNSISSALVSLIICAVLLGVGLAAQYVYAAQCSSTDGLCQIKAWSEAYLTVAVAMVLFIFMIIIALSVSDKPQTQPEPPERSYAEREWLHAYMTRLRTTCRMPENIVSELVTGTKDYEVENQDPIETADEHADKTIMRHF